MRRTSITFVALTFILLLAMASTSVGQGQGAGGRGGGGRGQGGQGRGQQAPARPAPRWPDGQINLGQVEGQPRGLWDIGPTQIPLARPDVASDFGLFAADTREPTDPFLASKPKLSQAPFQP